jgi:hypothetical protein
MERKNSPNEYLFNHSSNYDENDEDYSSISINSFDAFKYPEIESDEDNEIFALNAIFKPEKRKEKNKKMFGTKKVKKDNNFHGLVANLEEGEMDIEKINPEINAKKSIQKSFKANIGPNEPTKERTDQNSYIGKKRERTPEIKEEEEKEKGKKKTEKKYNYNIKIARSFFNDFILHNILEDLKEKYAPNQYFEKFSQVFIKKAIKKESKIFSKNMNLEEILTEKELYETEKKDEKVEKDKCFMQNLAVLNELKNNAKKNILENTFLNKYLKKMSRDLYQEYLKSNEYLEKTKEEDEKFKNYARNFIEYFPVSNI